ncbi:hypothetical protein [Leptospira jelokensis]|uniref:Uncharacterized protein n=1 Tax=Leptospira jelokensis TaxID=2484931 RepID=A0A4Z1AC74_9LEPT|nr:hypothetical protein [Leptospira jelokensis]TGL75678.1 hypothetical protein EHQ62_02300 [Leptospira jelokensis]
MNALQLCYLFAGSFFTVGLLCGIWKYFGILNSKDAVAHEYISILHRASLLYSFACLLLAKFVELSTLPENINFYAAFVSMGFFAFAQIVYLIHAILKDTDNQFAKPYRLGNWLYPSFLIHGSMVLLILGELGGFLILFWGFISSL